MPAAIGYPDWQRVQTRTDAPLFYQTVNNVSGFTSGAMAVANFDTVLLSITPFGTESWAGVVTFYADQGLTKAIWSDVIEFGATAGQFFVPYPVVGPFMAVQISPGVGGGASDRYIIAIEPTMNAVSRGFAGSLLLVNRQSLNLAGGGSDLTVLTPQWSGRAILKFFTDSPNWVLLMQYLDNTPAWTQFWFARGNAQTDTYYQLGLPKNPVRLSIQNGAAGAQNFDASIMSVV